MHIFLIDICFTISYNFIIKKEAATPKAQHAKIFDFILKLIGTAQQ